MLWKDKNGNTLKSPSTYKDTIEDTDNDSYTSVVDGSLVDNPIAVGMLKLEMTWDYLTETEAEDLLQLTYQNPLVLTIKCPSVKGGTLTNAKFRVSQRTSEMYSTTNDENVSKNKWKVSFNLMQKELTSQQKSDVQGAN